MLFIFSQKLRFAFAYVLCAILTDCLFGGVRYFGIIGLANQFPNFN